MSLQLMDEEEELVNINTYREDNKAIEYYYNSLQHCLNKARPNKMQALA